MSCNGRRLTTACTRECKLCCVRERTLWNLPAAASCLHLSSVHASSLWHTQLSVSLVEMYVRSLRCAGRGDGTGVGDVALDGELHCHGRMRRIERRTPAAQAHASNRPPRPFLIFVCAGTRWLRRFQRPRGGSRAALDLICVCMMVKRWMDWKSCLLVRCTYLLVAVVTDRTQ
jgi:hypothetical protein